MSDYIKRKDAYMYIHAQYPQLLDAGVQLVINAIPAADVVEVVRCKDCSRWCICHKSDDYFCADGKRRSEWTTIPMGTGSAVTAKTSHAVSAGRRK